MKTFTQILLTTLALLFFLACSGKPKHILSQEKMTEVLRDVYIARAIYTTSGDKYTNAKRDALVNSIYEKHNISQADYDSSVAWYSDNIELYQNLTDSIVKQIKAENEKLTKIKNIVNAKTNRLKDRAMMPSYTVLSPLQSIFTFNVDSVRLRSIDLKEYQFSFETHGIREQDTLQVGTIYKYRDTCIFEKRLITSNDKFVFDKPEHTDSLLINLSAFIRFRQSDSINSQIIIYNMGYIKDPIGEELETDPNKILQESSPFGL